MTASRARRSGASTARTRAWNGSGSHERDEAHALEPLAFDPARGALDDVEPLVAGLHRDDEPRAHPQLVLQGCWDVAASGRGDVDGVEWRRLRQSAPSVADDERHVVDLRGLEVAQRLLRQRHVALDAPHVRAEPPEQRRVVTRAGADIEDPLVALELEQLEHPCDDERLRDRLAGAD